MNLFLVHEDSLALLRHAWRSDELALTPADHVRLSQEGPATTGSALAGMSLPLLERPTPRSPIDIRRAGDARRWRSRIIRVSPGLETLPEKSYLEVICLRGPLAPDAEEGLRVFVEAPALALVSAASTLYRHVADGKLGSQAALARLVALEMELAGSYARDPLHPVTGNPTYGIAPVESIGETAAELELLGGRRGVELARRALAFANDGSGSPMETLWYLLFCLPPHLGGLHLERPLQNAALEIPKELRATACHQQLRPDFYWPGYGCVSEYDSRLHQSESSFHEDRRRAKDYGLLGLSYFPITDRDTASPRAVKAFLAQLAKSIEPGEGPAFTRRMRRILGDADVDAAREVLWATLMPPPTRWRDV